MIQLKITIPTYNRPEHIQRQVRDLLPQLRDGVSLIVYDNCSDIPVASHFTQEELSQFTLVRNKFNIGGKANIGKCLAENGDSGWIWLLGDDDRIADNAVDIILETIQNHQNCCYINFQQKKTEETKCFLDFLNYMKIIGAFGISFFQSACLFNMDKLKPYVLYFYEYLSSCVGQITMVIKYLEKNPNEHCLFSSTRFITDNSAGGWSQLDIIISSSLLIDKFHYNKNIMKGTLFKALGDMYFTLLAQANESRCSKGYYFRFIIKKLGLWNVFRYNYITFGQFVISVFLPTMMFKKIRTFFATRYRNTLK